MGSRLLRVVPDAENFRPTPEEVIDVARNVLPELRRARVRLAIENHDRFPARTLRRILQSVDSEYVGICLDTANSLGCGEGLETVLHELGPWVLNVHIKDFAVQRLSHQKGFIVEGRPAGEGLVDVPELIQRLQAHGRDPNAILELWPPPQSSWSESIALEQRWTEESVRYLRQFIKE
jgi:sugar phosphate isomerase/epimerase